jgi:predicted ATP-dependent serine protease
MQSVTQRVTAAKRLLGEIGRRRLDQAITLAEATDADAFAADPAADDDQKAWLRLADVTLREYRHGASEPGTRLSLAIQRAVRPRTTEIHHRDLQSPRGQCPRYRSGLASIDDATGGFYGVTCLGGAPGMGKSLVALRAALEAAVTGWRVVYYDCELGARNFASRVMRIVRMDPALYGPATANDCEGPEFEPARWSDFGHRLTDAPFQPRDLTRLESLQAWVYDMLEFIHHFDPHALIVLDSVNQAARMLASSGTSEEGWQLARQIAELAREVRKETAGAVSWLLVAELNRQGTIAGKDLEYIADLDLRLTAGTEPGFTHLRVAKGREGGEGDYGDHLRDWRNGQLVRLQ